LELPEKPGRLPLLAKKPLDDSVGILNLELRALDVGVLDFFFSVGEECGGSIHPSGGDVCIAELLPDRMRELPRLLLPLYLKLPLPLILLEDPVVLVTLVCLCG
jgi:hypothetical protein